MKKKTKLKLHRETLRNLSSDHLGKAQGGLDRTEPLSLCRICWYSDDYCPSDLDPC